MADETRTDIEKLRIMLGVDDFSEDILSTYLDIATQVVLKRLYPFGLPEEYEIPSQYNSNVIEIACYLINKRGGEGEISHSEGGVSRTYEDADIPSRYLDDIIPIPLIGEY